MPPHTERTTNPLRWLMPALAVATLAIGFWTWRQQDAAPEPVGPRDHAQQPAQDGDGGRPGAQDEAGAPRPASAEPLERSVPPKRQAIDQRAFAQGLRGIVIDADNRSLPDVTVHLVESAANDPLLLPLMRQQQHFLAPVASTRTDVDGSFALGLEVVQDKVYDVFVVSPVHATARLGGLRLLPGSWYELGAITLDEGATIRGRVTVKDQPTIPVPHAVVTVETGEAFADAALRALPQEQAELVAQVDTGGWFELRRVPVRGVVRVSAVAPGFARVTRRDIEMHATDGPDAGAPIVVDFELPAGHTLVGSARDERDRPIAGARIAAWPVEGDQEPLIAFTDERGNFQLHGLRTSTCRVRATANGFEPALEPTVELTAPLQLTLVERDRVLVVARTARGRVLRDYRLQLRRFFPQDPTAPLDAQAARDGRIGAVPEVRSRHVQVPADREHAEVVGVPAGMFVVAVEAEGFAPTLSLPFRCDPAQRGEQPQTVEVVVSRGVTLRGRVLDAFGEPLAGATVATQRNGTSPDSALFRVLARAVPSRASAQKATTDQNGWFRFERLALADYQLQIDHPDACRTFVRDLSFPVEVERTLPPITLPRGAIVRGRATHDGRVAAQMKVVLSTPDGADAERSLRLETITDAEGHYRFERRVPPGEYRLRASVVGQQAPDTEIFQQLLQMQRSSTTFSVPQGQDVVDLDYDLPSAN